MEAMRRLRAILSWLGLAARLAWTMILVPLRRLVAGPRLPTWSLRAELLAEVLRRESARAVAAEPHRVRGRLERLSARTPVARGVSVERQPLGRLPAEWHHPESWDAAADPTLLYLHGGGYVLGSPATHRLLMSRIARAAKARVVGIEYRLAPEAPFPAAVEDAEHAVETLLEDLRIPAQRLAIGGDSAGGGLTVATLIRRQQRGLSQPGAAALLSPWVDLTCNGRSIRDHARLDYLPPEGIPRFARLYAGATALDHPLVSPAHGDLAGLAPMLIQAGGAEALLSEIERFAARAQDAGVEVELEVWPGMIHVWHAFGRMIPQSRPAITEIGRFLRERAVAKTTLPAAG